MLTRPELEVSPGFLLVLGALFFLDEGVGLLSWGLLACAVHELGHLAAARVFGGRIRRLSLTAVGAELSVDYPMPLSYGRSSFVALAGPAVNLLAGALAVSMKCYIPAALNFGIGGFNLLPIQPLDGGAVFYNLLAEWLDPDWANRLMTAAAGCLVGLLVGAGAVAAVRYANITLLITALWLLSCVLRHGGGGLGGSGGLRRFGKCVRKQLAKRRQK